MFADDAVMAARTSMRQPTELLPDLGDGSAFGSPDHVDQLGVLCAGSWLLSTGHIGRLQIGALGCEFRA